MNEQGGSSGPRKGTAWHRKAAEARRAAGRRGTAAREEAMRRRLLDALGAASGPLDWMQLAVALGCTSDRSRIVARLAELEGDGLVVSAVEYRAPASGETRNRCLYATRVWSIAPTRPR